MMTYKSGGWAAWRLAARTIVRWPFVPEPDRVMGFTTLTRGSRTRLKRSRRDRRDYLGMSVMALAVTLIVLILSVQIGKTAIIVSQQKNIVSVHNEIRALEANLEALTIELQLQSRAEVVQQRAAQRLGMRFFTGADVLVLNKDAGSVVASLRQSDG